MGGRNNSPDNCKVRRVFRENRNKSTATRGSRCEDTGKSSERGSFKGLDEMVHGCYLGLREQGQGQAGEEAGEMNRSLDCARTCRPR